LWAAARLSALCVYIIPHIILLVNYRKYHNFAVSYNKKQPPFLAAVLDYLLAFVRKNILISIFPERLTLLKRVSGFDQIRFNFPYCLWVSGNR
jgi:hypothetical protein